MLKDIEEIKEMVGIQKEFFDIIRIVDPIKKIAYEFDENMSIFCIKQYKCYMSWSTGNSCTNCIAMHTYNEKKSYGKFEFVDNTIYNVMTKYIEVNGTGYVLEMIKDVTNSILMGSHSESGYENIICKIRNLNNKVVTDPLTKIFNRRYFDENIQAIIEKNISENKNCAFVMSDIDDFKRVNDTYGHLAGDKVLYTIAQLYKNNIKKYDFVIRFGGEEFLIILTNIEKGNAIKKVENMCKQVENTKIHVEEHTVSVTASFGVAFFYEGDNHGDNLNKKILNSIKICDKRLYKAKKEGKNKVVFL